MSLGKSRELLQVPNEELIEQSRFLAGRRCYCFLVILQSIPVS
jgi:hypothetical protein